MPNTWPGRGLRQVIPEKIGAKLGYYCFDTSTPITAGTWRAALSAAEVALTAGSRVSAGADAAFALCRPPGHHAGRTRTPAIASSTMRRSPRKRGPNAVRAVAILDVDYHHGNGTQQIFYDRDDVLDRALHADPKWDFPYFLGFAEEVGEGRRRGLQCQLSHALGHPMVPLCRGSCDARGDLPRRLDVRGLSRGRHLQGQNPISKFKLEMEDYPKIGAMIAELAGPPSSSWRATPSRRSASIRSPCSRVSRAEGSSVGAAPMLIEDQARTIAFLQDPASYGGKVEPLSASIPISRFLARRVCLQAEAGRTLQLSRFLHGGEARGGLRRRAGAEPAHGAHPIR